MMHTYYLCWHLCPIITAIVHGLFVGYVGFVAWNERRIWGKKRENTWRGDMAGVCYREDGR